MDSNSAWDMKVGVRFRVGRTGAFGGVKSGRHMVLGLAGLAFGVGTTELDDEPRTMVAPPKRWLSLNFVTCSDSASQAVAPRESVKAEGSLGIGNQAHQARTGTHTHPTIKAQVGANAATKMQAKHASLSPSVANKERVGTGSEKEACGRSLGPAAAAPSHQSSLEFEGNIP